jgi:hypothetical protein
VVLPALPTIASVAPSTGAQGASLTVTLTGANFQAGATVSFGADITIGSPTVISSTQLTVPVTVGSTAAAGARDVTVTNPGGLSGTRTGGFTVLPPPATLGLAYLGKLRDKVGANGSAPSPDGAADGTFQVTLGAGSGPRTVTRLELRRSDGNGIYDTDPATMFWALAVATSLDGALLNTGGGTVNFSVAEGGAFYMFASDAGTGLFSSGTSFTLTARFGDETTAATSVTIP